MNVILKSLENELKSFPGPTGRMTRSEKSHYMKKPV